MAGFWDKIGNVGASLGITSLLAFSPTNPAEAAGNQAVTPEHAAEPTEQVAEEAGIVKSFLGFLSAKAPDIAWEAETTEAMNARLQAEYKAKKAEQWANPSESRLAAQQALENMGKPLSVEEKEKHVAKQAERSPEQIELQAGIQARRINVAEEIRQLNINPSKKWIPEMGQTRIDRFNKEFKKKEPPKNNIVSAKGLRKSETHADHAKESHLSATTKEKNS